MADYCLAIGGYHLLYLFCVGYEIVRGGGASLKFLSGETLPGVAALLNNEQ